MAKNEKSVFISHSKEDDVGQDFLNFFFSSYNTGSYWYSRMNPYPPHARRLRDNLKKSESVFFLLSEAMDNPFTRAWVAYEIGLAVAFKKQVWVFEQVGKRTMVPIPFVTGFIEYNPEEKPTSQYDFPYGMLVENAGKIDDFKLFELPMGGSPFKVTICQSENCRSVYYACVLGDFHCPVCKTKFKKSNLLEIGDESILPFDENVDVNSYLEQISWTNVLAHAFKSMGRKEVRRSIKSRIKENLKKQKENRKSNFDEIF